MCCRLTVDHNDMYIIFIIVFSVLTTFAWYKICVFLLFIYLLLCQFFSHLSSWFSVTEAHTDEALYVMLSFDYFLLWFKLCLVYWFLSFWNFSLFLHITDFSVSSQCSECLLFIVMKFNIVENSASLLENVLVNIDLNCESLTAAESKLYISSITLKDDIFFRRHDSSEQNVKFHLKILKHFSYLSCLKICFKICLCDNTCSDLTLSIFLTSDNISIISVKKITETNLAHHSDLNSINHCENKILKHVCFDHLWSISVMYDLRIDVTNLSATELYSESIFRELETEFNTLHTIFKNSETVKLITQSHILNCVMINLMTLFETERESSLLNIWYFKHFIKHFI